MSMDAGYILIFLGISALSSLSCRNSAIGMIKRTNSTCCQKRSVTTPNWLKVLFGIRQHHIPRYLYFELLLSLVFAMLGPINLVIFTIADFSSNIAGVLVMIHISLIILDAITFTIISSFLKK